MDRSRLDLALYSRPLAALALKGLTRRVTIGGLYGSSRALALAALAREAPLLTLVADPMEMEALEDDLGTLVPELKALCFRPTGESTGADPESLQSLSERSALLRRLRDMTKGTVALVPAAVLLEHLPDPGSLDLRSLRVGVGDRCDPERLRVQLTLAGFETSPMVAKPADLSIRGDIVDLFPMGETQSIRIELFDDLVESIRSFDPETQLSVEQHAAITIPLLRPEELGAHGARPGRLKPHLPPGALTVRVEPDRLVERLEEHSFAHGIPRDVVQTARKSLETGPGVDLISPAVDPGDDTLNIPTLSVQGLGGGVDGLARSVESLRRNCSCLHVLAESDGELKRLRKLLEEKRLLDQDLHLSRGRVRTGFQLTEPGVAILNHLELLGKPRLFHPKPRRPAISTRVVTNILELTPGDYVVHLTHGIARFGGMVRMKREQGEEDFLSLEFHGETIFYLPSSKIDLIQRYVGSGATRPRLDRIGGSSWSRKKARVLASLEDLADELLAVQVARESRGRSVHPGDDPLIVEFESSFPFPDTPDQVRTMREIHADYDAERPMDRLVCGDVGFGKTEMAIRAAFRMICTGRQVAMLVPTTLLAEQHHEVFQARLANYPVNIAALSRFRSRKNQNAILEDLKEGRVDLVVGTHRLISKDVSFRDLGLVIIDEEQRFGVKAKEALKKLRRAVDVLTLTATPIPRTLHMALIGIRDISSLNTPPAGRRPVKTELRRFDPEMIRRALLFELDRGGQVFFVHNRVRSIERLGRLLAGLAPTARIELAHGQMAEKDLETAISRFAERKADILLSTAIIESGLDLPHANTMMIDRPDLFGLADLHQLRGRVGRSGVQAYCYMLLPDRPLPTVSMKRLKAVEELSHLGAGYDIAIKDLEIRGAGHLLGASQHGHIAAIGYDLFVQLLRRAVAQAKGQPPPPEPLETDVDLGVDAFFPAEYVSDPGQRMELLRRLGAPDGADPAEVQEEIRDRYGRIPGVTQNLLRVFALKRACRELGIRRMLYPGGRHVILEIRNLRTFTRHRLFPASDLIELKPHLWHLRLSKDRRGPQEVLEYLSETLSGV
ncbi:MAG: transcription-repair coupling factor [Planctomycetota bacterium]